MRLIRQNSLGLTYELVNICNTGQTKIFFRNKSIIVDMTLEEMSQAWYNWMMKGELIQHAFPKLSDSEREFIKTGITDEEWKRMFPDEDDDSSKQVGSNKPNRGV